MRKRRSIHPAVIFLFVAGLLMSLSVAAQTFRGAINGAVTDPSGAAVPGARVEATNTATGNSRSSITTTDGQFSFQDLTPGSYKVTVTTDGFPVSTIDNITVTAGNVYTLPVNLAIARQTTSVEVSAAAISLDTSSEVQTNNIAGDVLQSTPLNGRDFTQLVSTTPGFGGYSLGGFGSLNGARANQLNWQIDGTDNNDWWHNIPAVNQAGVSGIAGSVLPIDAVEEFSVQTQSSPETGRNPGGTVNVVVKSGGNTLHGSAYYFNRNEAFAATPPLLDDKQKVRNEQWGGSLGGRIIKDRTFYFIAFEKQKFTIGVPGTATVPSTAYATAARGVLATYGVPENTVSTQLLTNLWPGNILDAPASTGNYLSNDPESGYSYNGLAKIDHKINDKNTISFRWFAGQGNQDAPVGTDIAWYYQIAPLHVQNYTLVLNSELTPRLTNQLFAGVNYFKQVYSDSNNGIDPKDSGLFLSPSSTVIGAPNLRISGFDQTGRTPPLGRDDITGHLTDAVSFITGSHQIRFGGEYRRLHLNEYYLRNSVGSFQFNGQQGPWADDDTIPSNVKSLADFLAGDVYKSTLVIGDPRRKILGNAFALFTQDTWQIKPRLSLNFGLRYDYIGPFHDDSKDLSTFRPDLGGIVFQGDQIKSIYPADRNNFAPRLGFAYELSRNVGLVLRGSYGIFYDSTNLNPFLDNRPGNGGPNGVEANPAGSNPVSTIQLNGYVLPTDGSYIFPGTGPICPTGTGCGTTIYNVFSVNQHFRTAYFENYSLNIEKSLGHSAVWQIGYVGSEGRKLVSLTDINQADPSTGVQPYAAAFPNFGVINEVGSNGTSNYNSLQSTLKIRSWHRLSSQFAYTWAHALDEVTGYRGNLPQNSYDLKGDYGNSDFDTRHAFTAQLNYDLPNSNRGPRWLVNGWQLSSLLTIHTGQPFNVTTDTDNSGTNENFQRPNLIGDPFAGVSHSIITDSDGSKYVQWVNPAAFAQPADGTFGNLSRNKFYGPAYSSVDFSIFKNTKITERVTAQLRFEFYNLLNHNNWETPNTNPFSQASGWDSANSTNGFGRITDTIGSFNGAPGIGPGEPFNTQIALKIIF
jgi:hypothetical protein